MPLAVLLVSTLILPSMTYAETHTVRYIPVPQEWLTHLQEISPSSSPSVIAPLYQSPSPGTPAPSMTTADAKKIFDTEIQLAQIPMSPEALKMEHEKTAILTLNTAYTPIESRVITPTPRTRTSALSARLRGTILLQVQSRGEAYYVNPDNEKRYYLGSSADALRIMRDLGLGATHTFIEKYLNSTFPSKVSGKILIDVGDHGKAYYIYPKTKKAHYLGTPEDAFRIMRELGLGISNSDLAKIPE